MAKAGRTEQEESARALVSELRERDALVGRPFGAARELEHETYGVSRRNETAKRDDAARADERSHALGRHSRGLGDFRRRKDLRLRSRRCPHEILRTRYFGRGGGRG